MKPARSFVLFTLLAITCGFLTAFAEEPKQAADNFNRDQLVAWCIVPFDAKQRGPEARAIMVQGLGMTRVACSDV